MGSGEYSQPAVFWVTVVQINEDSDHGVIFEWEVGIVL